MPAPTLKVVADTPEFDHGEIDDRPVPAPKAINRRVSAAAAMAPAATAAHETAESPAPSSSSATIAISVARKSVIGSPSCPIMRSLCIRRRNNTQRELWFRSAGGLLLSRCGSSFCIAARVAQRTYRAPLLWLTAKRSITTEPESLMDVLFHGPSVPGPNIHQGANHEENRSRFPSRGWNFHADVGGRVLHRPGYRHQEVHHRRQEAHRHDPDGRRRRQGLYDARRGDHGHEDREDLPEHVSIREAAVRGGPAVSPEGEAKARREHGMAERKPPVLS